MKPVLVVSLAVILISLLPAVGFGFWAATRWALISMGADFGTARELATACVVIFVVALASIALSKIYY